MKNQLDKKDIFLIVIIIILIIVNLMLYRNKVLAPKQESDNTQNSSITVISENKEEKKVYNIPKTEEEIIKKLSQMNERDRMEYYCGKYLKYIDDKDYESAYNLLYTEFKKNYFPTYEDYVEYIQKTHSTSFAVEYDDISRQGTIYVLRLKLIDMLNGNKNDQKTQRIVIQEKYYNDFVISFQVI